MILYGLLSNLPKELKQRCYLSLVINSKINPDLWNEVINYFDQCCTEKENFLVELNDILKHESYDAKNDILDNIKKVNLDLFHDLTRKIFNIEDIVSIDKNIIESALKKIKNYDIIKITYGTSPQVQTLIQNICTEINLSQERAKFGSMKIEEVIDVHLKFVDIINELLINEQ